MGWGSYVTLSTLKYCSITRQYTEPVKWLQQERIYHFSYSDLKVISEGLIY